MGKISFVVTALLVAGIGVTSQFARAATDPCNAALSRFDYPAAMAAAWRGLDANPNDGGQLICLGRAQYETGDFRTALTSLTQASKTELAPTQRVLLQNWFGVTLRRLGRREEAWQAQLAGLALARQINDTPGLATALHNSAGMLYDQGYADQAIQTYLASLAINPDAAERSASLNNIGLILQSRGDLQGAEQALTEAIAINRAGGQFHHLGKHLMNLGNLRRLQHRYGEAAALIDEGNALEEKAGDRYWRAVAHRYRGWLARDQGNVSLALTELDKADRLYLEAGSPLEAAQTEGEKAQLGR
ncbi:MAG: tetratricopeptide repeat protein [Thiobacillaceae bacterium]